MLLLADRDTHVLAMISSSIRYIIVNLTRNKPPERQTRKPKLVRPLLVTLYLISTFNKTKMRFAVVTLAIFSGLVAAQSSAETTLATESASMLAYSGSTVDVIAGTSYVISGSQVVVSFSFFFSNEMNKAHQFDYRSKALQAHLQSLAFVSHMQQSE